jgi:plasmid stabilization system protein ParE
MVIKWSKLAVRHLLNAIQFIEEYDYLAHAEKFEKEILTTVEELSQYPDKYPLDNYKLNNDGTYRAFEMNNYRISYRVKVDEILIIRVRHTKRKVRPH